MPKEFIGINVLDAARRRIEWTFDNIPNIYVSFSGGKDSGVMLHLVMDEAIKRNRNVGLLFVDLEAQYELTINYIEEMYNLYSDHIKPFWVSLPLNLRNAVSMYAPQWTSWDPGLDESWVRKPHPKSITDESYFNFFKRRMEFEEFTPLFGKWYADEKLTACFVGIRADESLNRYRTIKSKRKQTIHGKQWTTWCGGTLYNAYPIYDWKTADIWKYNYLYKKPYNELYDRMHHAGLGIHQMRICQPYGDDQRKGLWLYQIIEPETWGKVVARVNGANQGALYSKESGNVTGNRIINRPPGHTWESFSKLLISSLPNATRTHYENKIAVFLKWYSDRGYKNGKIPDDGPLDKTRPSWKRICKSLLRNDYWCKGLSFSQHKSDAYDKYTKLMKRRREKWNAIFRNIQ